MRRFRTVVSVLLMALTASAQSGIDNIIKELERNNASLKALLSEHEATLLDIKAANGVSGPSVEYSPFFKKGYSGVAESELVVSEEIEFPTKYGDRKRQRSLQQRVNEAQYAKERTEVLLQARLLCLDVIRLNQTLQMLSQRQGNSEEILAMMEKRMAAGDANILELNKVKLDVMEVHTLVSEAQNERSALLAQLQGLNGGMAVELTDGRFPEIPQLPSFDSFREAYVSSEGSVREAESVLGAREHEVSAARRSWLPDISMGYRRNTEMGEAVNGVLVGVKFPIMGNGSRVKAARKRQEGAQLLLQQARKDAETTVRARYDEWQRLRSVLDHTDVEMMQQTLLLLGKALQHGEINALQYYSERNAIYEKLQRHIDVHCECCRLYAALTKYGSTLP